MSEREEATVEEMAHYLSEWLDDQAPFHERGIYRMVADDMVKKFAIVARHDPGLSSADDPKLAYREMHLCGCLYLNRKRAVTKRGATVAESVQPDGLTCAGCGDVSANTFIARLNHGVGSCTKLPLVRNHAAQCRMVLDGSLPVPTNCAAHEHHGNPGNFFPKGVPLECVRAELEQCEQWLEGK